MVNLTTCHPNPYEFHIIHKLAAPTALFYNTLSRYQIVNNPLLQPSIYKLAG